MLHGGFDEVEGLAPEIVEEVEADIRVLSRVPHSDEENWKQQILAVTRKVVQFCPKQVGKYMGEISEIARARARAIELEQNRRVPAN